MTAERRNPPRSSAGSTSSPPSSRHRYPVTFEELIPDVPAYAAEQKSREPPPHVRARQGRAAQVRRPHRNGPAPDEGEPQGYRLRTADFYLPYLALRRGGRGQAPQVDKYGYRSLPALTLRARGADGRRRGRGAGPQLGDPLLAEQAESAMRKLACDLPWTPRRAEATHVVPARDRRLGRLIGRSTARWKAGSDVTFRLPHDRQRLERRRKVEPFGLFFLNQHWYLAARAPGERWSRTTGSAGWTTSR